jgi:hypothetical protein
MKPIQLSGPRPRGYLDDPPFWITRRVRQSERKDCVMKATLIVIQYDTDHAEAKALIEKLTGSSNPEDGARIAAQTRLVEVYERYR